MKKPKNCDNPSATKAHISGSAAPKRRPRQERARLTFEAILEAAGQILVTDGYARASTNRIARRAGVSIGSLYQYFRNKEEIFLTLLEDHRRQMQPLKAQARQDLENGRPVAEVFRRSLERSRAVHTADPALMIAMETELFSLAAKHGLDSITAEERWIADVGAILTARPDLPASYPRERAWLATIMLEAVGRQLVHSPPAGLDLEVVVELVARAGALLVREDMGPGRARP
ncbi:hypothetical protein CSA17_02780 [bacterium DOLJORAL78_65_58]|nr:MAG: hypothetical protein CSB20_12260 [bacterium DOLZORAL124_64_63]PIE76328.1 MAG: hypothetical protein CSA17_02780 [bacterium DOLJORAL78_65_58]